MFIGQARGRKLIGELGALGFGEMTQPEEYPPRRHPWALDNGAFKLWRNELPFDGERFLSVAERAAEHAPRPTFVVCPDVVAGGLASLALSLAWAPKLAALGHRLALVVQDGMRPEDIEPHVGTFAVLFLGGTRSWKLRTAEAWTQFAHSHDLECHGGRFGSQEAVAVALSIGIDSIDSCLPLFSTGNLGRFVGALAGQPEPRRGWLGLDMAEDPFVSRPDRKPARVPRMGLRVAYSEQGEMF